MEIKTTLQSNIDKLDFNNLEFGKYFSDHMFSVQFKNGKWEGAKIMPFGPIHCSPATHVFHYGQAIFEGMKAYKNKHNEVLLFRPLENLRRFNSSAQRLCMPTVSEELFMGGMSELLKLDKDWIPNSDKKSLYIRPFMIANSEFIRATPSNDYRFMIITSPTASYYKGQTNLKIEEYYSRSVEGGTGYAKAAGNYAAAFSPTNKAKEEGFTQVVWTDAKTHSFIEESGTMNIMFRINDTLITPELGDSILGGITRDSIITLAKQMDIDVQERKVSVKEIIDSFKNNTLMEAFGVGTAVTINPIDSITYKDFKMTIKNSSDSSYASQLKNELLSIQYGKKQDVNQWTIKI